jgi:long-chain acyl-CoA synthetase
MARLGGRMRLAISGGAALPIEVARLFIGLGLPILQGYGLTETSPVVSANTPEDNDPRSVGRPLPGVELRFGEDQELLVRGPGLMMGYWNNPQATAQVINREGWLHTGDQARLERGRLYITGRIKDILVLSNGEKVAPADMESAIALDPLVEQAMVIGEGRPYVSAIVVLNREAWHELARSLALDPNKSESLQDNRVHKRLLARIGAQLRGFPAYAKVRRVIPTVEPWTIENGLVTPTLKVRRSLLLAKFAKEIEEVYAHGLAPAAA